MENNIKVSILCAVYNHENYLTKCLDGFIMQSTNFDFEVIIHDDASTDSSSAIIKTYVEKYPDIIKPIFQTENQYSKDPNIVQKFIVPHCSGDYWAICEGDDYWTDKYKLQKQYDFMITHPDCVMCTHGTMEFDVLTKKNKKHGTLNKSGYVSLVQTLHGLGGHTSSFFYKKEVLTTRPSCFYCRGIGDLQTRIYASIIGKLYYIDECMSVYNYNSGVDAWSTKINSNLQKMIKQHQDIIDMLENVNKFYKYKYKDDIQKRILNTEISILMLQNNYRAILNKKYKVARKSIPHTRVFKVYMGAYTPFLLNIINKLRGKKW